MRIFIHAGLCAVLASSLIAGPLSMAAFADPGAAQVAQSSTGTISGTVTDSRNAPQVGASVVATGPGGVVRTTTDDTGQFTLRVDPGLYDVVVTKGGFQTYETDGIGVVRGSGTNLAISLSEIDLSSLRVIGSVTSRGGTPINNRPAAVTTLSGAQILARSQMNLNEIVPNLPGVSLGRGTGTTPNTNFIVRGSILEAKTEIDGHPLSSGVFGEYNTNYANAAIFNQIEVLKGVGVNGPNSGESPIGTVNLRTRDFTSTAQGLLAAGQDGYGGSYYNAWFSSNLLKNDRLSFVLAKSMSGYNGLAKGYNANRIGLTSSSTFNLNDNFAQTGLVQWQGDLAYPYVLSAELAKARYRFSDSTSLTFQFLGMQGKYTQQGGSYASYYGSRVIAPCYTQTTPATPTASGVFTATGTYASNLTAANCNAFSQYNAPYTQSIVGTNAQFYSWFPSSVVQNNEPYWSAEFRTTLKNDTILVRPYAAIINRFISGAIENQYPGNGGGWFQVTNTANCTTKFTPPNGTTGAGASGPCFGSNAGPSSTPYVNAGSPGSVFPTQSSSPIACSVGSPCYTTFTQYENDGLLGYGTPFSQPEVDHLRGITFQYIHPAGNNLYGFSYDWNKDDTSKLSGDTTTPPAGCTATVAAGQGVPNVPATNGYQPTCPLPFLPRTGINIPSTQVTHGDFALTGIIQASSKLQVQAGAYLTTWKANYQIEDPALVATFGANAPVSLLPQTRSLSHFDPQIGLTYRASPSVSFRASGGSGVTVPYAGQISGLAFVDLPNGANNLTYSYQPPNPALLPETTVAYNLGTDVRMKDGGVISLDLFHDTIHNVFILNNLPQTPSFPVPGCPVAALVCQVSEQINGPIERNYGVELTLNKTPALGFGYFATVTVQRAFYDQLPASIYNVSAGSFLINGKQLDGGGSQIVPFAKGYGEINYAWDRGGHASVGVAWEGSNNSTYGPSYAVWNASLRQAINPLGTYIQMSIDNLLNYNSGTFIGQGTLNNGFVRYGLKPGPGGTLVPQASSTSIQIVPARNMRLEMGFPLGHT